MFDFLDELGITEEQASRTKFKFNISVDGDPNKPAFKLLKNNFSGFLTMTAWRNSGPNSNLDDFDYVISFARDPVNNKRYLFGGLYYVENLPNVKNIRDQEGYRLYLDQKTKEKIGKLSVILNDTPKPTYGVKYQTIKDIGLLLEVESKD